MAAVEQVVAEAARGDAFLANNPPEVDWHGFLADGYVLEPGTEAEAVLAGAHAAVHGEEMPARLTTAVNDTRYYGLVYRHARPLLRARRARGRMPSTSGPRSAELKTCTLAIAAFIADWCGVRSRAG